MYVYFVNFKQSFLIADEGSFQETSAKIRKKKDFTTNNLKTTNMWINFLKLYLICTLLGKLLYISNTTIMYVINWANNYTK